MVFDDKEHIIVCIMSVMLIFLVMCFSFLTEVAIASGPMQFVASIGFCVKSMYRTD